MQKKPFNLQSGMSAVSSGRSFVVTSSLRRLFLLFPVFFSWQLHATEEVFYNQLIGAQIINGATLEVKDDKFLVPAEWATIDAHRSVRNLIVFEIYEDGNLYRNATFTQNITIKIEKWDSNNTLTTETRTLSVNYNPAAGTNYTQRAYYYFPDAHKVVVTVMTAPAQNTYVRLSSKILIDRVYQFSTTANFSTLSHADSSATFTSSKMLRINWTNMAGAAEYDVEYTFYNAKSRVAREITAGTPTYTNFDWLFVNNASRITTDKNQVTIQLTYPDGYILYRVRGVRYRADGTREEGKWSSAGLGSAISLASFAQKYQYTAAHLSAMNWSMLKTFAEGGKTKATIQYYDGSMKMRQEVTELKQERKSLVTDHYYDFFGRKVIDVLPYVNSDFVLSYARDSIRINATTRPTPAAFDPGTCDYAGIQLSGVYGAGKYYGTANKYLPSTDIPEFIRYIPRSDGYHYTQTRFTPDRTNRVAAQSGPGGSLKPASGHETMYFYGKPSQTELDRIFGNDVGFAHQYQKNLVIDPNGQASVSYLNAAGQTIATALSGESPAGITALPSNTGGTTVSMTDSILHARLVDGRIVSTYTYLATTPVDLEISFNINPAAYNEKCRSTICFDCHYDAVVTVKDACGSLNYQYTYKNYTLEVFDTLCHTPNAAIVQSFVIPAKEVVPGEIFIQLDLSVSEDAIRHYSEVFMHENSCIPAPAELDEYFSEIFDQNCFETCEECYASLGGSSNAFVQAYKARLLDMGLPWTPADSLEARQIYNRNLANCRAYCERPSECDMLEEAMMADLSPGGQYAGYSVDPLTSVYSTTDVTSIFYNHSGTGPLYRQPLTPYLDEDGVTPSVIRINGLDYPPQELGMKDFIFYWQPSWAASLLDYHPEYCYLEWCRDNYKLLMSGQSIKTADTYEAASWFAMDNNILDLDAFFGIGTPGEDYRDELEYFLDYIYGSNLADTLTLRELVNIIVYCNGSYPCATTDGCTADRDRWWRTYRDIYLAQRQRVICRIAGEYADICATIVDPDCIGIDDVGCGVDNPYAPKQRRWICPEDYSGSVSEITDRISDMRTETETALLADCESGCEAMADQWMAELAACSCLSDPVKKSAARTRFIAICKRACHANRPFGATTCPTPTSYGDTSFEGALNAVCGTTYSPCDTACNVRKINTPGRHIHRQYLGPEQSSYLSPVAEENCVCTSLSALYSCYQNKPLSDPSPSFLAFLSQMSNYNLTPAELDTLMSRCTTSCRYLPDPISLPPYLMCNTCRSGSDVAAARAAFILSCGMSYDQGAYVMYMNHTLGLNLEVTDYDAFLARWADYSSIGACTNGFLLCPRTYTTDNPVSDCMEVFLEHMATQRAIAYSAILDSLRAVFRERYVAHCLAQPKAMLLNRDHKEYHYTLYYFDQSGNLVKTVPPEGVAYLNSTQINQARIYRNTGTGTQQYPGHARSTKYWYNSLNQVYKQLTPDGGATEYWYDRIGRVVITRESRNAASNRYGYTRYDALGRIYETGQIVNATAVSATPYTTATFNTWYGSGSARYHVTRHYYDQTRYATPAAEFTSGAQENLLRRLASSAYFKNFADTVNYNHATHYTYDVSGNVKELIQDYPDVPAGQRYMITGYEYDLVSGNVSSVRYQKGKPDHFTHRYRYDEDNRLTHVETSVDGFVWDRDAQYQYYPHGPLGRHEIGEIRVQGTDYAYTLQGWLKAVNASVLSDSLDIGKDGRSGTGYPHSRYVARDAAAFTLGYFFGDYTRVTSTSGHYPELAYSSVSAFNSGGVSLYNGNIRNSMYGIRDVDSDLTKGYTYNYDQLNRLTQQRAWAGYNGTAFHWNSVLVPSTAYRENYAYSAAGNITGLRRTDESGNVIDSLIYYYYNNHQTSEYPSQKNNRLQRVTDNGASSGTKGDVIHQTNTSNYVYDLSGNLVQDIQAGLNIAWTPTGKIDSVLQSSGQVIKFEYDAQDRRRVKIIRPVSSTHDTAYYYSRDIEGNILAVYSFRYPKPAYNTPEAVREYRLAEHHLYGLERLGVFNNSMRLFYAGGIIPIEDEEIEPTLASWITGRKRYELRNHLGNVLSVISDRKVDAGTTAGTPVTHYLPDVRTASDYYPFGWAMPGRQSNVGGYRFGFNGQEMDNEPQGNGNSYSFEYRVHDPRIGRFLSVDPVIYRYPYWTPYQFAGNMPIKYMDLEGLQPGERAFRTGLLLTNPKAHAVELQAEAQMRDRMQQIKPMEAAHFLLDGIGTVPFFGEAADALNGFLYLFEGDKVNAGFSFAATAPFAGIGATGAKWARKTLKYSDNAFHSASGLVFKQGSKHGNRLSHVLAHTADDLSKAKHGVFSIGQDNLVSTLDEAWEMARKGGDKVVRTLQDNGNVSYIIDMGRKIGFEGGKKGSHEALNRINIVLEEGTSNVITAYPIK